MMDSIRILADSGSRRISSFYLAGWVHHRLTSLMPVPLCLPRNQDWTFRSVDGRYLYTTLYPPPPIFSFLSKLYSFWKFSNPHENYTGFLTSTTCLTLSHPSSRIEYRNASLRSPRLRQVAKIQPSCLYHRAIPGLQRFPSTQQPFRLPQLPEANLPTSHRQHCKQRAHEWVHRREFQVRTAT